MLDPALRELKRFVVAARRLPAAGSTSSSWYDVVAVGEAVVAVVGRFGAGVSVEPARRLRTSLLACLVDTRSPAAALRAADPEVRLLLDGEGTIALCAVLDASDGVARWAAVGPASALVIGSPRQPTRAMADRDSADASAAPGALIEVPVLAGQTVALCTAGAAAAEGLAGGLGDDAGPELLAGSFAARLDVEDAALVLVRVMPQPLSGRMAAELPSVPRVRRMLSRWAHQAGLSPDGAADLELTVSEAVSNVVEHAYRDEPAGEFDYLVRREGNGVVRVEVRDFGRWRPQPIDPGYRGRGLAVIRTLATDVALDGTSSGTRIAFTLPAQAVSLGAPGPAGSGLSDGFRPVSGSDAGEATR